MESSSDKCLGLTHGGPGDLSEQPWLSTVQVRLNLLPIHPHWPAASTLTIAQAPNCPSTPPLNASRQHSHCLIKVQGFNRSLKKKKPNYSYPGPSHLAHCP